MFRVLNITCLLGYDYEQPESAGTSWRISRINIPGGSEQDPLDWYVELRSDGRTRVMSWRDFLTGCRVRGDAAASVQDLLLAQLDALQKKVRGTQALADLIQNDAAWRRLFAPALEWVNTDPEPGARGGQKRVLLDAMDADRASLRAARLSGSAPEDAVILKLRKGKNPGAIKHVKRDLDQAFGSCRRLLSVAERWTTPAKAESVALTLIGGVASRALLEIARERFPEHSIEGVARVGGERPLVRLGGKRFRAVAEIALPIWNAKTPATYPLWIEIGMTPAARPDQTALGNILAELVDAMKAWAAQCREPLIRDGDGWLALVDGVPWDEETFQRWLRSSPVAEKIARIATLPAPSAGDEKRRGWQLLLAAVTEQAAALDAQQWPMVVKNFKKWDEAARAALNQELQKRAELAVATPGSTAFQLKGWLDLVGAADPAAGAFHLALLEKLSSRAETRKSADEFRVAFAWWQQIGSPPQSVPPLARACRAIGLEEAALAAALRNALVAGDDRRIASDALDQCAHALKRDGDRAVLFPLAQVDAAFLKWSLDEAIRKSATNLVDDWARELGQSQRPADWARLVETRETLQRVKLYG